MTTEVLNLDGYPPIELTLEEPYIPDDPSVQRSKYWWRTTISGVRYGAYLVLTDRKAETISEARELLKQDALESIKEINNGNDNEARLDEAI